MSDIEEIGQIVSLIGHLVDNRTWERLGEVYAADAVFVLASGAAFEGLAAIQDFMPTFKHPIAHFTTNVFVELEPDGDHAVAISKCLNPHEIGHFVIAEYHDRFVRSSVGWRLQRREAVILGYWPERRT